MLKAFDEPWSVQRVWHTYVSTLFAAAILHQDKQRHPSTLVVLGNTALDLIGILLSVGHSHRKVHYLLGIAPLTPEQVFPAALSPGSSESNWTNLSAMEFMRGWLRRPSLALGLR